MWLAGSRGIEAWAKCNVSKPWRQGSAIADIAPFRAFTRPRPGTQAPNQAPKPAPQIRHHGRFFNGHDSGRGMSLAAALLSRHSLLAPGFASPSSPLATGASEALIPSFGHLAATAKVASCLLDETHSLEHSSLSGVLTPLSNVFLTYGVLSNKLQRPYGQHELASFRR